MAKRACSPGRPRAVAYTRVSTGKQADQGGSLAVQRDRCVEHAVLNGLELVNVYEDALSGARGEEARPGFRAALNAIRSGEASVLIVTDADRFSRDSDNAGHARVEVKRAGGKVVVISEAHAGVEIVAVRQLLAVLEREKIRARMRTWSAARQAKGLPMGRAPYGSAFGPDGRLRPDTETAGTVARILGLRAQDASLHAIADALNAADVPGPTGKPWNLMTVSNILKRLEAQTPMRIPFRPGGLFSGADGPVIFQVPANLYADAKCDVLLGRVFKRELDGDVLFAECRVGAFPDGLGADAFTIEESPRPGLGAARDQRSFFLSRKLAGGKETS